MTEPLGRLGILGGTFNPPHLAHLIAGECAVEEFTLDRLLFIPANIPPHKVGHDLAPANDRLEMTRLATEGNDRFEASGIEIAREGKSYTIDTIHELKKMYEPNEIVLLIGLDNLEIFASWHRSEEIFDAARIAVMLRPSYDLDSIDRKLRERVEILRIPLLEISSTDIRARVAAGKSIRYLVPDAVGAYIADRGLYC